MTTSRNNDADITMSAILNAAIDIAGRDGFAAISNASVSNAIGRGPSLISHYYSGWNPGHARDTGAKPNLKCEVLREAIRTGRTKVIDRALAAHDAKLLAWPTALLTKARKAR